MLYQTPYVLTVRDPEGLISFSRENMMSYAGLGQLIASGVVMCLLNRAFSDLCPNSVPWRDRIRILSAFPGQGVIDSIELVTRAVTSGRFILDPDAAPADAPKTPAGGAMYYEVAYEDRGFAYTFSKNIFNEYWSSQVLSNQDGCPSEESHADYIRYKLEVVAQLLTRNDAICRIEPLADSRLGRLLGK
jgi:hypothetical protein